MWTDKVLLTTHLTSPFVYQVVFCVLKMFHGKAGQCRDPLHSAVVLCQAQWGAATWDHLLRWKLQGRGLQHKVFHKCSIQWQWKTKMSQAVATVTVWANAFAAQCLSHNFALFYTHMFYIFKFCVRHSVISHTQISSSAVEITASHPVCLCACGMHSGFQYVCVICLLMCMNKLSAALHADPVIRIMAPSASWC